MLATFVLVPSILASQPYRQLEVEKRADFTTEDYTFDFLDELDERPLAVFNAGSSPALFDTFIAGVMLPIPSCTLNLPHTHPRASEIALVLRGKLTMGFVEENGGQVHEYELRKG